MNQTIDGQLIDSLSAQPLGGDHWMQRARFAAELILGSTALALVCQSGSRGVFQAGLVDRDGIVIDEPAEHLEHVFSGTIPPPLADLEITEQALNQNQIAAFNVQALSALMLPWPLGLQSKFAFVLFDPKIVTDENSLMRKSAFLSVASNLLRRATKRALVDAAAWIEAEIDKLANLQNLLQPSDLEEVIGVDFAIHSRPHAYAGGDYYDVAEVGTPLIDSRCLISVADVSGHGPAAVVETAMMDSILRTFTDAMPHLGDRGPAQVMTYLNRHMFTRRPRPSFATMFASELDVSSGNLRYCIAGHPPPILKSSKGCEFIPAGDGIPLQILRDYQWEELSLQINPGELLIAYSDGITETLSPAGVQFGQSRLLEIVERGPGDPRRLLQQILDELTRHAESRTFHDDQTIVIAKYCDTANLS